MQRLAELVLTMPPVSHPGDDRGLLFALQGCHNFRSVAGWQTHDGRTLARGRLFRSDGLDELSDRDLAVVAGLGLRHVFDVRAAAEITRAPSRWPDSMNLSVWTGAESAAEADIMALMARDGMNGDAFHAAMCRVYARFPEDLASAVKSLGVALLGEGSITTLVHCTAGKDRTGFVIAMLLRAIGILPEQVMADYLMSNLSYDRAFRRFNADGRLDRVEAHAPGAIAALVGVHAEYLQAAMQRIDDDFAGIDTWLDRVAGLDARRRTELAKRLLD